MEAAEVFNFARAVGIANRHPDPDQFAQDVSDAYTPPAAAAPAPTTKAARAAAATQA